MTNYKVTRFITRFFFILFLSLAVLALIAPIYHMISSSFKTQREMVNFKYFFRFSPTLDNYREVFRKYELVVPLKNSFIISVSATVLACVLGLPAAYAISRHRMNRISTVILCVRIIPVITFLVPWYIIMSRLHLLDTKIAIVFANLLIMLPLIIWIVSPYFGSISKELEEAAFIDGCSEAKSFLVIMIPLAVPGILTATILAFIKVWNNFMFSYVLGGPHSRTLPVMLKLFMGYDAVDYPCLMTGAVVVAMPVVIMSVFMQKYVVSGLTAGAVKE